MNICWFFFKWGLLACVLGVVVAAAYLYRHVDDQIRRRVQRQLAEHYAGLQVTVGAAELVEGEGIKVRDVSIVEPGVEGPSAELIHVDELFLACRGDLKDLVTGQPEVSRVVIRRPTLRVARRAGGAWAASKLLPLPQFARQPPEVTVENGTIELFPSSGRRGGPLSLGNVHLTLCVPPDSPKASPSGPGIVPFPLGEKGDRSRLRKLEGTLSGDFLGRLHVAGLVDPAGLDWSVAGSVDRLQVSPQLAGWLPEPCPGKLAALGSLRGQATARFRASRKGSSASPYRFELAGRLEQGSLDDPRLPRPLTDISAAFRVTDEGFVIDALSASSGPSTLEASCRGIGFGENAPLWLEAKIRQLELDRQLAGMLPASFRAAWEKFLPAGRAHVDLTLSYDGRTWKPEGVLECLDASFSYHKFPYRLQQCTGSVALEDGVLRADLTGYSGSQPVRVHCRLSDPLGVPYGWTEATGDNIPLDQKLLAAMAERPRAVVRSFHPQGTMNCFYRAWRDGPEAPPHRRLVATLNRVRLRYDKFPYPMSNVRGTLEMVDDRWTFRKLEGTNDTGVVTGEGYWNAAPEGSEFFMQLAGANVPLEEELRDALEKPYMRQLWNDLRVRGTVDLEVEIRRHGRRPPTVAVRATPHSEKTSLEPVCFPYRLEKIRGSIRYQDGEVMLDHVKAEHGETAISAVGRCRLLPDGSRIFALEDLWVDRLRADRELIQALPERLRKMMAPLHPGGLIDLHGTLQVAGAPHADAPVRSEWDLDVGFQQGSLDVGVVLENLNGQLKLVGRFDGTRLSCRGELAVDSLTYHDVQFTELMGPIWIDDDQVLFGSSVGGRLSGGPPRDVTGRVLGGTVFGHGRITRADPPAWRLQANLSQGDLNRCARELLHGHQHLQGKVRATIDLWGAGRSVNAMGGRGRVELRDADIYELPVMVALLKILSIREPDLSAFSESDANFTVKGPHVYFSQINFKGDAVSLEGNGEMDLDTAVRLRLRARLGLQQIDLPLLKELLGGASEQILLIHVGGTLGNPVITKEPFPTVNHALQQLQSDLQKTTGPQGLLPRAGRWLPDPGQILPQ